MVMFHRRLLGSGSGSPPFLWPLFLEFGVFDVLIVDVHAFDTPLPALRWVRSAPIPTLLSVLSHSLVVGGK